MPKHKVGVDRDGAPSAFVDSYIRTALWSSNDESDDSGGGEPLDRNYSESDLTKEALKKMTADADRFYRENREDLASGTDSLGGHDFWLTRNGHGAGFWDGDWPEPQASRLTAASKRFGESSLYVSRGKIHVE